MKSPISDEMSQTSDTHTPPPTPRASPSLLPSQPATRLSSFVNVDDVDGEKSASEQLQQQQSQSSVTTNVQQQLAADEDVDVDDDRVT